MLPLPAEATIEEKTNTFRTDSVPCRLPMKTKNYYSRKFGFTHRIGHNIINTDGEEETGQFRMGKGQWVTDNGSKL